MNKIFPSCWEKFSNSVTGGGTQSFLQFPLYHLNFWTNTKPCRRRGGGGRNSLRSQMIVQQQCGKGRDISKWTIKYENFMTYILLIWNNTQENLMQISAFLSNEEQYVALPLKAKIYASLSIQKWFFRSGKSGKSINGSDIISIITVRKQRGCWKILIMSSVLNYWK